MTDTTANPVAQVEAVIAGIAPGLRPAPHTRDAVLVTGPWLAGTTSLVAALRERLPGCTFVETGDLLGAEAPMAVLFVSSALTPLTEPDCALLDAAAAHTDLVIGVVSKIDVRQNWRDVLTADKDTLGAHADRYRDVRWIGAAAAPGLGEQNIDELVDALHNALSDDQLARRNRLRSWESRLQTVIGQCEREAGSVHTQLARLRELREHALQQRRAAKSERTNALRTHIQRARVQLAYFASNRCVSVKSELQQDIRAMTRRKLPDFESYVHQRVDDVVAEVNSGITHQLRDVAKELRLTPPPDAPKPASPRILSPPLKQHTNVTRLMLLLGAAIGLGVALALSLLLLPADQPIAAAVAGAVVGFAVTALVINSRGLRRDRAALDHWVSDVVVELAAAVDQRVAERVVGAEMAFTAESVEADDVEAADVAERVAAIDAQLREHGLGAARAAARRNSDLPTLQAALKRVRSELESDRC